MLWTFKFAVAIFLVSAYFTLVRSQRLVDLDGNDGNAQERTLQLFHKFDTDPSFTKRAEITFVVTSGVGKYIAEVLSDNDKQRLVEGVGQFYQIKVVDQSTEREVISSVKACLLPSSKWNDKLVLHLDENNDFFHADYYTEVGECGVVDALEIPLASFFSTKIRISRPYVGPKPQVLKAVPLKEDGKPVPKADETPWYQKYWYFIIPLIVLSLLPGPEEPQGGGK